MVYVIDLTRTFGSRWTTGDIVWAPCQSPGTGGASVSPSADAGVANSQAGSCVHCDVDKVKDSSRSTPPQSSAVTVNESRLVSSPVRSSDVTRVLQQRRQERKGMSPSGQSSSNVSKDRKKSSKR